MADLIQQFRDAVTGNRWNAAVEPLQRRTPGDAAGMILALPFERQQFLFRHLPKPLAATLVARLPVPSGSARASTFLSN